MKSFKKLTLLILVLATILMGALTLSACGGKGDNGSQKENLIPTEGLKYELNADGESYSVDGIGEATDLDIVIPSTYLGKPVTSIGSSAFEDCSNLTSVTIGNNVTSIGDYAFAYCSNLINVTIPNSVITIGDRAFFSCSKLSGIEVKKGNLNYCSINGNLYNKDGSILIQYAVGKTDATFTIPSTVTSIGEWAFYICSDLKNVTIGSSVITIGNNAFCFCFNLANIMFAENSELTSIGSSVFRDCSYLTSIEIPNSVTSIGEDAFRGCISLSNMGVAEGNLNYCSINGNLYNKEATTLIQYAIGKTDTTFIIPNTVTSIEDYAFCRCYNLTSVIIPNSVTSIGEDAFSGCSRLTNVTIGNSVESIGDSAFSGCYNLTNVTFESKEGWFVTTDSTATSGTDIASTDLENTSTAAAYLTSNYSSCYWKRNV